MKPATTAVSRPDTEEVWITKKEAAQLLAVRRNGGKPQPLSERRILEYTQAGALRSALQREPRHGQMAVMVSREDVLRLKHEREHPAVLPAIPREPRQQKLLGTPASAPKQDTYANNRAWLALNEAEAYTGLPESHLLGMIHSGELLARDVGVRPGGRYRVKRSDLDAIEGRGVASADLRPAS